MQLKDSRQKVLLNPNCDSFLYPMDVKIKNKIKTHKMLSVSILTNDLNAKNQTYIRIFTNNQRYEKPIFIAPQIPTNKWMENMRDHMTNKQSIELYNHYILWNKVVETNTPMFILYNDTQPTQNDNIWSYFILNAMDNFTKFGKFCNKENQGLDLDTDVRLSKDQCDIFLFGKYLDNCFTFKHIKHGNNPYINTKEKSDHVCKNSGNQNDYIILPDNNVYQTTDVHGTYAYLLTPDGAKKIISYLLNKPMNIDNLLHRIILEQKIVAYEYHPSIVVSNINPETRFECKNIRSNTYLWMFIVFVILGLLITGILWLVYVNIEYIPPKKDLNINYNVRGESNKNIIVHSTIRQNIDDIIPYGPKFGVHLQPDP